MGRLDGKVALIFGAGPNNGGTIAHFMAREGARVAVNDIIPEAATDTVNFLKKKGYDAIALPGDASVEAEVKSIVGAGRGPLRLRGHDGQPRGATVPLAGHGHQPA